MTPAKQFEHAGLTVKLYQDTDAQSPQAYDTDKGLFLVGKHRQFWVCEPGEKTIPEEFETLVERYQGTHWIFPLEAYIHSGVVLALAHTGNFPDRQWDVSQLGAVFCAKSEWRLSASARKAAQRYVETWNQYLSGDVYGFVIEDEDGNHLERRVCTGTQMGRRNELPTDTNERIKLRLEKLRFVDGDYDQWGAYWGGGRDSLPIYCAWGDSEETQVRVFVRAQDRVAAKAHVLKLLPNATFARP